jgi:hypothetical protein
MYSIIGGEACSAAVWEGYGTFHALITVLPSLITVLLLDMD